METEACDRDGSLSAYSPASAIQSWLDETEDGGWVHLAPSSTAAADLSTNGSVASTAMQDMQEYQQHAWQGLAPPAASSAERSSYYADTQSEMFGVPAANEGYPANSLVSMRHSHGQSLHGEATTQPTRTSSSCGAVPPSQNKLPLGQPIPYSGSGAAAAVAGTAVAGPLQPMPVQATFAAGSSAAALSPKQLTSSTGPSGSGVNTHAPTDPVHVSIQQPWQQQLVQQQARLQQLRPLGSDLGEAVQPQQKQQQQHQQQQQQALLKQPRSPPSNLAGPVQQQRHQQLRPLQAGLGSSAQQQQLQLPQNQAVQQQQQQQQQREQVGHALLSVLNPLESVLWQQRQHSRALLDRALHALTSLQFDVDKLLVAAKPCGQNTQQERTQLLALQQQQPSQQQQGQPLQPLQHQELPLIQQHQSQQQQGQQQAMQDQALLLQQLAQLPGQQQSQQQMLQAMVPQSQRQVQAQHEQGKLGPQQQKQQQQQAGQWSIAAGWVTGHLPVAAESAGSAWPLVVVAQDAAQREAEGAPVQQQQQQQQLPPREQESVDPSPPPAAAAPAAAAAADADLAADFEAELLQAEAAAPGRRLSDETLKQYTSLVWHSSMDGTEEGGGSGAAAAAAGDGSGDGTATAAGAAAGACSGGRGRTSSSSGRIRGARVPTTDAAKHIQHADAILVAVPTVSAQQQQQQQQQGADVVFNSADDFEMQLLALEAAAPGTRQMSAAALVDADAAAAGEWVSSGDAVAAAESGRAYAVGQGAATTAAAAEAREGSSFGSGASNISSSSSSSKQLSRHVTFKLPQEFTGAVDPQNPQQLEAMAQIDSEAAVGVAAAAAAVGVEGTAAAVGGNGDAAVGMGETSFQRRSGSRSSSGSGSTLGSASSIASSSVNQQQRDGGLTGALGDNADAAQPAAAAAAAAAQGIASPGCLEVGGTQPAGGSGAERLQLQLEKGSSFGGLRACDSSSSIGCLGSFHGTPAAAAAAAAAAGGGGQQQRACVRVSAPAAAAVAGDGSSIAGSSEEGLGIICSSSSNSNSKGEGNGERGPFGLPEGDGDDFGDDFEALLRAQEASARAAAGVTADGRHEDRWWSNDGGGAAAAAAAAGGSGSSNGVGGVPWGSERGCKDSETAHQQQQQQQQQMQPAVVQQQQQTEEPATGTAPALSNSSGSGDSSDGSRLNCGGGSDSHTGSTSKVQAAGLGARANISSEEQFLPLDLGRAGSIGGTLGLPLSPGATGLLEYEQSAVAGDGTGGSRRSTGQQQQQQQQQEQYGLPPQPAAAGGGEASRRSTGQQQQQQQQQFGKPLQGPTAAVDTASSRRSTAQQEQQCLHEPQPGTSTGGTVASSNGGPTAAAAAAATAATNGQPGQRAMQEQQQQQPALQGASSNSSFSISSSEGSSLPAADSSTAAGQPAAAAAAVAGAPEAVPQSNSQRVPSNKCSSSFAGWGAEGSPVGWQGLPPIAAAADATSSTLRQFSSNSSSRSHCQCRRESGRRASGGTDGSRGSDEPNAGQVQQVLQQGRGPADAAVISAAAAAAGVAASVTRGHAAPPAAAATTPPRCLLEAAAAAGQCEGQVVTDSQWRAAAVPEIYQLGAVSSQCHSAAAAAAAAVVPMAPQRKLRQVQSMPGAAGRSPGPQYGGPFTLPGTSAVQPVLVVLPSAPAGTAVQPMGLPQEQQQQQLRSLSVGHAGWSDMTHPAAAAAAPGAPAAAAAAAASASINPAPGVPTLLLPGISAMGGCLWDDTAVAPKEPHCSQQSADGPLRCVGAFQQLRQQQQQQQEAIRALQSGCSGSPTYPESATCLEATPAPNFSAGGWDGRCFDSPCGVDNLAADSSSDLLSDMHGVRLTGQQCWEVPAGQCSRGLAEPWLQQRRRQQQQQQQQQHGECEWEWTPQQQSNSLPHFQQQQQQQQPQYSLAGLRQTARELEQQQGLEQQLQSLDRQVQQLQRKAAAAGCADRQLQSAVKAQLEQWQQQRQQQEQQDFQAACAAAVMGSGGARKHNGRRRRKDTFVADCTDLASHQRQLDLGYQRDRVLSGCGSGTTRSGGVCCCAVYCSCGDSLPATAAAAAADAAAAAAAAAFDSGSIEGWYSPRRPGTAAHGAYASRVDPTGHLGSLVSPYKHARRPSSAGAVLTVLPCQDGAAGFVAGGNSSNSFWSPQKHSAAVAAYAIERAAAAAAGRTRPPAYHSSGSCRSSSSSSSSRSRWLLQAGLQECRQEVLEQQAFAAEAASLAAETRVVAAAIRQFPLL